MIYGCSGRRKWRVIVLFGLLIFALLAVPFFPAQFIPTKRWLSLYSAVIFVLLIFLYVDHKQGLTGSSPREVFGTFFLHLFSGSALCGVLVRIYTLEKRENGWTRKQAVIFTVSSFVFSSVFIFMLANA